MGFVKFRGHHDFSSMMMSDDHWRRKLENFKGDGDENSGVKGRLPLQNSAILALFLSIFSSSLEF